MKPYVPGRFRVAVSPRVITVTFELTEMDPRRFTGQFLRCYLDPFTYDLEQNGLIWFGVLWGLPVPVSFLVFDAYLSSGSLLRLLYHHPIHWFFLLHPLLFGLFFGAAGTLLKYRGEDLQRRATRDDLTGVQNRAHFEQQTRRRVVEAERYQKRLALVMLDLDFFKEINDTHGHGTGDEVLMELAQLLRRETRQSDVICRFGGDEFLILLTETNLNEARKMTRRILGAIERCSFSGGEPLSVSGGIAVYPQDGADLDSLLEQADRCLYTAKERGRCRVVYTVSRQNQSEQYEITAS